MTELNAERVVVETHQCVCTLVDEITGARDRCRMVGVPMDQAFCDECEQDGHDKLPGQKPTLPNKEI